MRGKITYKVHARQIFILSLLRLEGVAAYAVRQKGEDCFFSVRGKDKERAEKALRTHEKEFVIVSDHSLRSFGRQNRGRIGVYVGLAIVIVAGILWSQLVTDAVVSGNERVDREEILSAVLDGENLPQRKNMMDLHDAEKRVVAVKGVSNAALEIKGSVLYVRITEELEEPRVEDYAAIRDRVSAYDGVVTSVVPLGGTPLVQEGDVIKKGDVVLSCKMTDEEGKEIPVRAYGMVYARVWMTKEILVPPTVLVAERTGRKTTYYVGSSSEKRPQVPYETYEAEEETVTSFFSFGYKKITFYETTTREETLEYEREKERLIREGTDELEKSLPTDAKKVRTWYNEKILDKNHLLVIYYEIVVNVIK